MTNYQLFNFIPIVFKKLLLHNFTKLCSIVFLCPLVSVAQIQQQQYIQDNHLFQLVDYKEGEFNQSSFRYCVADKNGIFWIGTEMGLFKYEGTSITKVIDERFPSINTNRIVKLGKDFETGDIIFVTYPENSLYSIQDNKIEKINYLKYPTQYLFSEYNDCLLPNTAFHKRVIDYIQENSFLYNYNNVGEVGMIKLKDSIYILMDTTIIIFNKNGNIQHLNFPNLKQFTLLRFENLILIVSKGEVFQLLENKLIPVKTDSIIQSYANEINGISKGNFFGTDGNYLLNHNGAIYHVLFKDNKLSTKFLISNVENNKMFIDYYKSKDVYFFKNFSSVLLTVKPLKFNTITVEDSERNNCYAVAIINKNTWLSATGWIYNKETKETKDAFRIMYNKGFLLPFEGEHYTVSTNFLHNIKNQKEAGFYKSTGYTTGYTYFKNNLWISEDNALLYLKNNRFETDTFLSEKIKKLNVNGIYTFNDQIILVTNNGVYFYKPFFSLTPIKGLENVYARYFKQIDKNSFWIGCYGDGLFLVQNGKVIKVKEQNFDLSAPHAIEEDAKGNLWISTNNGLLTVNKKKALKSILNNVPIECYRFSTDDGLPTNEFNGGGTNPSLQDEEGIIGFPSVKGFVWFDPEKTTKHLFTDAIVVDKLRVDEIKVYPQKEKYLIGSNAEIIDIDISFAYYYSRENISVEYRFADESVWHKIMDNSFQIARTSAGDCKLLVRIHTHSFDAKSDVIKTINLHFQPKFTETYWFWMIIVFVLIALIYIGLQIGLRINKEREKLLKQKVEEKTVELQNTVSELALSKEEISKSLKEKELLLKEIHHRVKNNLQLVISLLNIQGRRNSYQTIEEFLEKGQTRIMAMVLIHENLYQNESIERLNVQEYIQNLLDSIIDSFGFSKEDLGYTIEAEQIYFTLETSISFGLIINELIANILKHAFPDKRKGIIKIEVSQIDVNEFELVVIDNGVGFKKTKQNKRSFGLELIELLVTQLNGSIKINNQEGTTTKINFSESYF